MLIELFSEEDDCFGKELVGISTKEAIDNDSAFRSADSDESFGDANKSFERDRKQYILVN